MLLYKLLRFPDTLYDGFLPPFVKIQEQNNALKMKVNMLHGHLSGQKLHCHILKYIVQKPGLGYGLRSPHGRRIYAEKQDTVVPGRQIRVQSFHFGGMLP